MIGTGWGQRNSELQTDMAGEEELGKQDQAKVKGWPGSLLELSHAAAPTPEDSEERPCL